MSFEQSVNEDTIPVAKQVLIGIHGMGTLYLTYAQYPTHGITANYFIPHCLGSCEALEIC